MNIIDMSTFVDYIKLELGAPVINIELTDLQIQEKIQDSVELFQRYNYGEGNYKDYLIFTLSAGVNEYSLSGTDIIQTIDFAMSSSAGGINTLFSPTNILASDLIASMQSGGGNLALSSYQSAMMYLKEIDNMFGKSFNVDYRPGSQILRVTPTPNVEYVGVLQVYKKETSLILYKNPLLKRLAISNTKMLWGEILSKHSVTLPGGSTINGTDIYSRAKEDFDLTLENIKQESEPPIFFIG